MTALQIGAASDGEGARHAMIETHARTYLPLAALLLVAPLLMALLRRRLDQLIDAHSSVGASYVTYDVTARGSEAENSPGLRLVAVGPDVC